MRKTLFALLFTIIMTAYAGNRVWGSELLMFESPTCEWCEKWDEEIGTIYNNTDEGRTARLHRLTIHHTLPAQYGYVKAVLFTPTFVLVDGGRELGRIVGYPGEVYFWGLLDELLNRQSAETTRGAAEPDT